MKKMINKENMAQPDFVEKMAQDIMEKTLQGEKPSLSFLMESLLNEIMKKDRERYLAQNTQDTSNGFYERDLKLTLGELNLKIPRVRFNANNFRPAILPAKWKRIDKDYEELLIAMLSNGYSHSQIQRACKKLNLPFSKETLDDTLELIQEKMDFYKNAELSSDWLVIFIDAYHASLRDEDRKNIKTSIFVAVGIDLEGFKHILGFWVCKGSENKAFWTDVLQDLVRRGVHKVLLFATDNFNGLTSVVSKLFPYAEHQLCMVHMARNLHRQLSKKNAKLAMHYWHNIKNAQNFDEGSSLFDKLIELINSEKKDMAKLYASLKSNFLPFLNYPSDIRKFIYTTNSVESINSGIDRMRIELGGYFPSIRSLEVNLFIQFVNLQDSWWRKPLPIIRANIYEIKQIFALRYELLD